jgi:hypothetical protein
MIIETKSAPTKAQMQAAIAQTLALPFAYNSLVDVMDFKVDGTGKISGRFKDSARPRVFSFELDGNTVNFKPYAPGRMDSGDAVEQWEEFSSGYSYRVDAGVGDKKKPQCVKPTAYNCGAACINIMKSCKIKTDDSTVKDRIKKLNEIGKDYAKTTKSTKPQKMSESVKIAKVDPVEVEEVDPPNRKPAKQEEVKARQQPPGQKVGKLTLSVPSVEEILETVEEWTDEGKKYNTFARKVLKAYPNDEIIEYGKNKNKIERKLLEKKIGLVSDARAVAFGLGISAEELEPGLQDAFFLKDESGKTQGFFLTGNDKSKESMYIEFLGTNPTNIMKNTKGVGKQIIYHAIQESIKRGFKGKIKLEALPSAESFYESVGFKKHIVDNTQFEDAYFDLSEESAKAFVEEYEKRLK